MNGVGAYLRICADHFYVTDRVVDALSASASEQRLPTDLYSVYGSRTIGGAERLTTSNTFQQMPDQNSTALRFLQWLVAIGFFMQTLDSTIVNTALPTMAHSLGESPLKMQSVIIAYGLTMAMFIPASGWLADRFGICRTYSAAILLFVVGSACCALSHTLTQLVIARIVQGMGGAMLLPIGRLSLMRAFPPAQLLAAMSFVAIPGLVGPLIGPTLGGWIVEVASWRWIFLINIPIGVIGLIATRIYMPAGRDVQPGRFDLSGYLLISTGMFAVSLALDGLSELGLRHAMVLLLLFFGLASLTAYWLHAAKTEHPLFSTDLFKIRTFSIGILGNLFARVGSGSMPFLVPLLLQVTLGYSPVQAGMAMVPLAVAAIMTKRYVTQLITRAGYRMVLVSNTFLLGAAMASFALITPTQPIWLRIIQLGIFGMLNSIQFTAMNTIVLKDLDRTNASSGNSLLSVVQMLSISMGVAAAGALLAIFNDLYARGDATRALPAFHATFICVGILTSMSAWIFWQLAPDIRSVHKTEAPVDLG